MRYRQYYAYSMSKNRKVKISRVLNLWFNIRRVAGFPVQAQRIEE